LAHAPANRRRFNLRLIRRTVTYSVPQISNLLSVHPNTVLRWVRAGLPLIDDSKPYVVHGANLYAFLKQRQAKRKRPCGKGELFCFGCRAPRRPAPESLWIEQKNANTLTIRAQCGVCGTRINRCGAAKRLEAYRDEFFGSGLSMREERLVGPTTPLDKSDFTRVSQNDEIQPT
jgi:hypothetical protein